MRSALFLLLAAGLWAQEPVGIFLGEIAGGMGKLRLALEVKKSADGKLSSEMISLDQAYARIPGSSTVLEGKTLKVAFSALNASFEGGFSEDGSTLTGKFTQGLPMDLVLKRIGSLPLPPRPQEPKPPFPYDSEEVNFAGGAAEVKLAGTFTKPKGAAKVAAVVFVSGSGPQDRDESLAMHKPFLVLADHLARAGFASLRYDDRGTAKSTGTFRRSTTNDFAKDAAGAVAYLRTRKDVDAARIFVLGHSEGGMIAPMLAAEDAKIAGLVLLAGTAVTGEKVLRRQLPDLNRAAGMSEEMAQKAAELGLEKVETQRSFDPWLANFWTYDPAPALQKVKCPVLALNGELDMQVNATVNLDAMRVAFEEGGNKRVTLKTLPKLNHLFQTAVTGSGNEYGRIEETISPLALGEISEWLKKIPATP